MISRTQFQVKREVKFDFPFDFKFAARAKIRVEANTSFSLVAQLARSVYGCNRKFSKHVSKYPKSPTTGVICQTMPRSVYACAEKPDSAATGRRKTWLHWQTQVLRSVCTCNQKYHSAKLTWCMRARQGTSTNPHRLVTILHSKPSWQPEPIWSMRVRQSQQPQKSKAHSLWQTGSNPQSTLCPTRRSRDSAGSTFLEFQTDTRETVC